MKPTEKQAKHIRKLTAHYYEFLTEWQTDAGQNIWNTGKKALRHMKLRKLLRSDQKKQMRRLARLDGKEECRQAMSDLNK